MKSDRRSLLCQKEPKHTPVAAMKHIKAPNLDLHAQPEVIWCRPCGQILFSGDGLDRPARRCSGPPPALSAGARRRSFACAGPPPGALDDFLGTAVAGAGV